MKILTFAPGLCLAAFLLYAPALTRPARADETAQQLRDLAQKHAASIVTVAVTISAEDQQLEIEAEGLVVDDSGLIMTTNTAIDPYSMSPDASGTVSNVVSAKIVLPGGTEVPARLMLRDKTRNLAFLRPLQPLGLPGLPLATSRATAQQGNNISIVGRLGKAGSRLPSVANMRLLAVIEKPRTLYVLPTDATAKLGEAAFNEAGELLGIISLRVGTAGRASFNETDRYLATIIPCADAFAVAQQTPALTDKDKAAAKPADKPAPTKPATAPATKSPAMKPATAPVTKPATSQTVPTTILQIIDERVGSGPVAKKGDTLRMNYKGTLQNGKVFDQSYGDDPYEFQLGAGRVIEGWDKGIVGMKVGGKRKLVIPAKMAYGADSSNPDIPANSVLVFDVELLAVNGKTK